MRDKTDQIIEAATKVFIKKGLSATTAELADKSGVAEVTLFRKFGNKQKMFIAVVQHVLDRKLSSKIDEFSKYSTAEFLEKLIDNRLMTLSRNQELVNMLIAESLMGRLPPDIHLPAIIYSTLTKGIQSHAEYHGLDLQEELIARQLSGIFLSHLILNHTPGYHEMDEEQKKQYLSECVTSITVHSK